VASALTTARLERWQLRVLGCEEVVRYAAGTRWAVLDRLTDDYVHAPAPDFEAMSVGTLP
jgi:hypothetical protein